MTTGKKRVSGSCSASRWRARASSIAHSPSRGKKSPRLIVSRDLGFCGEQIMTGHFLRLRQAEKKKDRGCDVRENAVLDAKTPRIFGDVNEVDEVRGVRGVR